MAHSHLPNPTPFAPQKDYSDERHEHIFRPAGINRVFFIGIMLNVGIVAGEAITGFLFNSLALLTDAGHNLGDVAGLLLAWVAYYLSSLKPKGRFTYGYQKTTILTALANAVILLVSVAVIMYSAVNRFQHPRPLNGLYISITALAAIFLNALAAYMFVKDSRKDLNIRGAFLHMASDALVSAGVLAGGIIMYFTHWYIIDSLISVGISLVIVYSTWGMLAESLNLSLDAAPRDIDMTGILADMQKTKGVINIHHLHIWALGTTQNALTAHVVVDARLNHEAVEEIKQKIKSALADKNVQHATLETEYDEAHCADAGC